MDMKLVATVFSTVFFAELGDKTQLATMLYSSRSPGDRWTVFFAASLALVAACAMGVAAGDLVSRYADPRLLSRIAGVAFVVIGIWTFVKA